MRINSVSFKNFRCFGEFRLDLDPHLNVLIARNGRGKTTILDGLSYGLAPFVRAMGYCKEPALSFDKNDVRRVRARQTKSDEMEPRYPARIGLSGTLGDGRDTNWFLEKLLPGERSYPDNTAPVRDYAKRLQYMASDSATSTETVFPLIGYYRTSREHTFPHTRTGSSRIDAYKGCIGTASSFRVFAEWFEYMTKAEFESHLEAEQSGKVFEGSEFRDAIASVRNAVNLCLRHSGWQDIKYSAKRRTLTATHALHGTIPVAQLSDGIRMMIGLVGDIAFRATKLNPQLGANAARDTPGIVLIDEVDMHLHPEWQQIVLRDLTNAFKNIQFVVTTHSPQVLTTVHAKHIRILEEQEGRIRVRFPAYETYAHESREVLEDIMAVDSRPALPEAEKLEQYLDLVSQGEYASARARALRQELEGVFGEGYSRLRLADLSISKQEAIAQSRNRP